MYQTHSLIKYIFYWSVLKFLSNLFFFIPVSSFVMVSSEISENFHLSIPTETIEVHGSMSSVARNFLPSLELDTQQSSPVQESGR